MDVFVVSAPKSATGEGNSTETPVTNAKHKRSITKHKVYDKNLVGKIVKVWWHGDKKYYEGVVVEFYPDMKKHKVSYVDGDEETLNLKQEKWKILKKFSRRDVKEQNTEKIGKDNDLKESENVKYNDVKESENQNENDNHVKISEKEAVIPPETGKDKETIQEFSLKAVESKCAATANVSSACQSNGVLNESSVRSNKEKPVPQEVETASPSKSQSPPDETRVDVSQKSAAKAASKEVSDTIRYDESLVGLKVKAWWPEDKTYNEGVVDEFYPAKKKHKVSYVDGDVEMLNLKTQKWEILKEFSARKDEEQNPEVHSEEGSPERHKTKKPKTDAAASQEKIKDSAMKVGEVSSSGKSKGSTPKDNLSTHKNSGKSCDAATTASKEAAKSKEDEERLKINTKTKAVNKSNSKTPPSSSKFNVSPTKAEKMEYDKERLRLEAEKLKIKADKGQSKIRLQDERLRLKAEKMELLKKESDIRIMMIDARVMPEMQRLYFEELQREIIMRRSHT